MISYQKIPETLQNLKLSLEAMKLLNKASWVVTEKVHGANFCFIYESQNLKYAKRKALLNWKDDFFGFQLMVQKLEANILALFEDLHKTYGANTYYIYGELCGGHYPHTQMANDTRLNAVQTGVYYAPDIVFYAFDIAFKSTEQSTEQEFLNYDMAIEYFERHGLLYAKPLFIGKYQEALEFSPKFHSNIPKLLDLPPLEDNWAEGIVIKPVQHLFVDSAKGKIRPIIKIKHPRFSEDKGYHQAIKWSFKTDVQTRSEQLGFLLPALKNYVTLNRLHSVKSKIGNIDFQKKDELNALEQTFFQDVFETFNENQEDLLDDLTKDELNWLRQRLSNDFLTLIEDGEMR